MSELDVGPFLDKITEPLHWGTLLLFLWYFLFYAAAKRGVNWSWAGMTWAVSLLSGGKITDPFTLSLLAQIDQATLMESNGRPTLLTPAGLRVVFNSTVDRNPWVYSGCEHQERLDEQVPDARCLSAIRKRACTRLRHQSEAKKRIGRETWTAALAKKAV